MTKFLEIFGTAGSVGQTDPSAAGITSSLHRIGLVRHAGNVAVELRVLELATRTNRVKHEPRPRAGAAAALLLRLRVLDAAAIASFARFGRLVSVSVTFRQVQVLLPGGYNSVPAAAVGPPRLARSESGADSCGVNSDLPRRCPGGSHGHHHGAWACKYKLAAWESRVSEAQFGQLEMNTARNLKQN